MLIKIVNSKHTSKYIVYLQKLQSIKKSTLERKWLRSCDYKSSVPRAINNKRTLCFPIRLCQKKLAELKHRESNNNNPEIQIIWGRKKTIGMTS